MKEENSLIASPSLQDVAVHFDKARLNQMTALANEFFKAGCFGADVKNPQQVLVKMQAGFEMGMAPIEAMNSLYIVNGRITIYGHAMIKKLKQAGYKVSFEDTADSCTATVARGEESYSYTATADELRKINSKAFSFAPKEKMRYHAISRILRFELPEVLSTNLYFEGEVPPDSGATITSVPVEVKKELTVKEVKEAISKAMTVDVLNDIGYMIADQQYSPEEFKELREAVIKRRQSFGEGAKEPEVEEVEEAEIVEPKKKKEPEAEEKGADYAPTPKEEKKKALDPSKHYTPEKVKGYLKNLHTHEEVRGLKNELNRFYGTGEITETSWRESIAYCQEKETTLASSQRQASLPDK